MPPSVRKLPKEGDVKAVKAVIKAVFRLVLATALAVFFLLIASGLFDAAQGTSAWVGYVYLLGGFGAIAYAMYGWMVTCVLVLLDLVAAVSSWLPGEKTPNNQPVEPTDSTLDPTPDKDDVYA